MKLSALVLSLFLLAQGGQPPWAERLAFWMHPDLRDAVQRITAVDQLLATLPELTQINSSTSIGFKTVRMPEEKELWVEIALPQTAQVDTVVLIPALAKAARGVVPGYGFPVRFRLEAFDDQGAATTLLDASARDFRHTSGWPLRASFLPLSARRVRLTAVEPWQLDGPPVLALAEMMILSGGRNVAAGAVVTSSSSYEYPGNWSRQNLVDMITPLGLPELPLKTGAPGFHSTVALKDDEVKTVTLTLPQSIPLDEIRLVPVRRRQVPLWFDYGFPVNYKIETATQQDFSDARLFHEVTSMRPPVHGMNLACFSLGRSPARYLRITASRLWKRRNDFLFALAEVQAFSDGKNVALGGSVTSSDRLAGQDGAAWSPSALTDGLTEAGRLISLPEWFSQLEQRRLLEAERAGLLALRGSRIASAQHTLVYGSIGSVGLVSLLSGFLLWRQRRQRLIQTQRLHEKLACDLHDEIGSNLGSIRLICSLARQSDMTLETLRNDLNQIEQVAAESADSIRDLVTIINPRRSDDAHNWLDVLQSLPERLLRGITLDSSLPERPLASEPDIETRRELYLFCKEVLNNIAKHARATHVRFHLIPGPRGLRLEIHDNGTGFDTTAPSGGHGLGNLRERAAVMHGTMELVSAPGRGTRVALDLPRTHLWARATSREPSTPAV